MSKEEIRALTSATDLGGWRATLFSWGLIALSFTLVGLYPNVITIALALIIIGGRQLALAVLMHECAHRSLFATRGLNDVLGKWAMGAPIWTCLRRYRVHHMAHHNHTGTERDTDLGLVEAFPTTRGGVWRKFARDLCGLTGLRRLFGLFLMDIGVLSYTASLGARRQSPSLGEMLRQGVVNLTPVVLTNAALFGALWAAGQPLLYLLWLGAYLTTFSLFVRIRSIAEHACTEGGPSILVNTRTTRANWLARLTVAPHNVNYHLEHHFLMSAPYDKLPTLHRMLRERGALEGSAQASGYTEVLRLAASGAAAEERPTPPG